MLSPGRGIDGLDRLDVRLVALLGIALLPIGLIAMVQTYRVIDEADQNAEATLLSATLSAVTTERESILRIRGAAQIVASVVPDLVDDPLSCSDRMQDFVGEYPTVSFVGYVSEDGILQCASDGRGTDVRDTEVYRAYSEEAAPGVRAVVGSISGRSVVVITQPVRRAGKAAGYVALAIPQRSLAMDDISTPVLRPLETLSFTSEGEILWSTGGAVEDSATLPRGSELAALATPEPVTFQEESNTGIPYVYTVAPLVPGEIYTMSVWPNRAIRPGGLTAASAILFPLLMWLVSIGVAYFAVHRLVVRHIRYLRLRIRAFTANRRILEPPVGTDTPTELREVIETFHHMTQRIVRDEADLENNLHEKDVLLKEVYHRVKNNLQLIASMTNMQMRKAKSNETRFVLRRLQDRVLGLATIHRNLYQSSVLSRVNAGKLVLDLVDQSLRISEAERQGIEMTIEVAEVELYPDQAVPLSLLVTETMTNALRYVGQPAIGAPRITLNLEQREDGSVRLRVENTVGEPLNPEAHENSSGLGTQLMRAFVMQLDAESNFVSDDERYAIDVIFQPSDFGEER